MLRSGLILRREMRAEEAAAATGEMPDVSATEKGMSHSGMLEYDYAVRFGGRKNAADG